MARTGPDRRCGRRARQGFTLLEVAIALLIVSTVLVSLTGAFLSTAQAVQSAKGVSRATVFLQSVMESLEAQPYDALPSFHGNRIFNRDTQQASNWSVDLSVLPAGIDLEQVDATLLELRSGRVLAQISTLRSRR